MELEAGTNDHQFSLAAKRPVVMARRLQNIGGSHISAQEEFIAGLFLAPT